jgi:rubrerythrin
MIFNFNAAEVFKIAIEIEENGKKFYESAQSVIDDPGVNKLFQELAREEVEHKKKFESLLAQLSPDVATPVVWDPDNNLAQYIKMMADQHVFLSSGEMDGLLAGIKNAKDALELAIEFEKDSVIFFLSMQEATEGKKGQELVEVLIKEEREHLKRLALELKRMSR